MRNTEEGSDCVAGPEGSGLAPGLSFDEQPLTVSAAATTTTAKLFNRRFITTSPEIVTQSANM
jgi:hypothetical protein